MTDETYTLPPAAAPTNHGHTKAAWMLVVGVVLGALVIGVGLAIGNVNVWVVGMVLTLAAVLASGAMRARGRGQPVGDSKRRDWYAD